MMMNVQYRKSRTSKLSKDPGPSAHMDSLPFSAQCSSTDWPRASVLVPNGDVWLSTAHGRRQVPVESGSLQPRRQRHFTVSSSPHWPEQQRQLTVGRALF